MDEMTEPTLAELLDYPKGVEEVTAERMLRYLLVQSRVLEARVADAAAEPDNANLRRYAGEYAMAFAAAYLLRAWIVDVRAPVVDGDWLSLGDTVKELWESWEDGANMGEWLCDGLTAEGIDPEQIQLAYEAARDG